MSSIKRKTDLCLYEFHCIVCFHDVFPESLQIWATSGNDAIRLCKMCVSLKLPTYKIASCSPNIPKQNVGLLWQTCGALGKM